MQNIDLAEELKTVLQKPDLFTIAQGLHITLDPNLKLPLLLIRSKENYHLSIGGASPRFPSLAPTLIRYGIELFHFLKADIPPALASCASARITAQSHFFNPTEKDPLPLFLSPFGSNHPDEKVLQRRIADLCIFLPDSKIPNEKERQNAIHTVISLWSHLSPLENLISLDEPKLKIDLNTGLNGYFCSYRPRPWVIEFGSSSASSLSQRSFNNAESTRRSMMASLLTKEPLDTVKEKHLFSIREKIGQRFNMSIEQVILSASDAHSELAALSLITSQATHSISVILIAPEDMDHDICLAAQGRHFLTNTDHTNTINTGELINGFPQDIKLFPIPIKTAKGINRTREEIDKECENLTLREIDAGRHVLLHRLDQSPTGMVAPSIHVINDLTQRLGNKISIVVNACQGRISSKRITTWINQGIIVMISGSKFLMGPPLCGAVLLPKTVASRLHQTSLPSGLQPYNHHAEWPKTANHNAFHTKNNVGLILRWEAALAEMDAFFAYSNETICTHLTTFTNFIKTEIQRYPQLHLLPPPSLGNDPLWDSITTILSFLINDPQVPNQLLSLKDTKRLHRWLNADLTPWVPKSHSEAGTLCILGQPISVTHETQRTPAGALRLCAGARLVSGDQLHQKIDTTKHLSQECDNIRRVFKKILLILHYWPILLEADPIPRYLPLSQSS